ncbi:GAF domain-containing protein [Subtercola boreus]|uniref:GAF domain-containing protein n=1 Tax=Subtercola boreus TaxID=120213 RepID=UPI0015594F19|nr:GAF domain-containing protein [Subtercola boreus]
MSIGTAAHDLELLQKTLKSLTLRAEFPLAFGGLVTKDGAPLTAFVGTRGSTLNGLIIEPTEGLGGRAIAERRPVTATQYRGSPAITHRYDREVLAEQIVCLLAVPVVVNGSVRAVVYGAHRTATQLGDPVIRTSLALATALGFEYSVHDEVERRLAVLETEGGLVLQTRLASRSATSCGNSTPNSVPSPEPWTTVPSPPASMRSGRTSARERGRSRSWGAMHPEPVRNSPRANSTCWRVSPSESGTVSSRASSGCGRAR